MKDHLIMYALLVVPLQVVEHAVKLVEAERNPLAWCLRPTVFFQRICTAEVWLGFFTVFKHLTLEKKHNFGDMLFLLSVLYKNMHVDVHLSSFMSGLLII